MDGARLFGSAALMGHLAHWRGPRSGAIRLDGLVAPLDALFVGVCLYGEEECVGAWHGPQRDM
eukprot:564034-Prymnesium_polylepis.1